MAVGEAPGHCPHPLELFCFGVQIPPHTWDSPHPAPGLSAGVGVGRRVESFRFFLLMVLLEHQGPCHPGVCCRRKEAEQGEGNNGGAVLVALLLPLGAAPEIPTRYLGEPSTVSSRIPLQSWPVIWGSALFGSLGFPWAAGEEALPAPTGNSSWAPASSTPPRLGSFSPRCPGYWPQRTKLSPSLATNLLC